MGDLEGGEEKTTAPPSTSESPRVRVLIVDDNFNFRSALAQLLRRDPSITIVGRACNGLHALRFARRMHPDVVLMDIEMRGMGGVEATRRLTAEFPQVKVIGLSSCPVDSQESRAMQAAGAAAYVCKSQSVPLGKHVATMIHRMMAGPVGSVTQPSTP
jgi:DNA-binding NarL/FixJ family response regulator